MLKVQWYPGHMTKAKRKLIEQIKTIDVIIELRDARIPLASGNPDINKLASGKGHIILLNKADLADSKINKKFLNYFQNDLKIPAATIRGTDTKSVKKTLALLEEQSEIIFEKRRNKGLFNRSLRCMVLGISNVGKSTYINSLAGKKVAQTGDRPGVTKGNQWIKLTSKIELLDTPGILWPKFEGEDTGFYLAITGAVSDLVFDNIEAAEMLVSRIPAFKDQNPRDTIANFGIQRGLLLKGGVVDLEKAAFLFIKDYRSGRFGHFTLEPFKES